MSPSSQEASWFEMLLGTLTVVSLFVTTLLIASLRYHVDEAKLRAEPSVVKIFAGRIPPERVLTRVGKRRTKMAKIGIGVLVLCVTVLVIKNQILSP
jgi:hypothetical protein